MFFLLDYKQASVLYKGETRKYIDIEVGPYEDKSIEVKVDNLREGFHDFITLLVRKDTKQVKQGEFVEPEKIFLSSRVNLVVKEGRNFPYYAPTKVSAKPSNIQGNISFFSKQPAINYSQLVTSLNYTDIPNIHLNFLSQEIKSTYVIILVNGNEVIDTKMLEAESKGLISIPMKIKLDKIKDNAFFSVICDKPFTQLENTSITHPVRFTNIVFLEK